MTSRSCLLALTVAAAVQAQADVVLVNKGAPACVLIVPHEPGQAPWFGAGEIQRHVTAITGVTLPVLTDDQTEAIAAAKGTRILLGDTRQTRELGLSAATLARQEYVIRTLPGNRLVLLGRDIMRQAADEPKLTSLRLDVRPNDGEWPTLYAVYDLLERGLGVRWYAPGGDGTCLPPKTDTLVAKLADVRRKPAFFDRRAPFGVNYEAWGTPAPSGDEIALFRLRNKLWRGEIVSHSFEHYPARFLDRNSPEFEAYHPEYFAQGRDHLGDQMCFSSPALVAQAVKDAREYFDGKGNHCGNAGDGWVGLVPRDTEVECKCAECQKLLTQHDRNTFSNGVASQLVWSFTDKVARELAKTHPDRFVAQLAYADYSACPDGLELAPNILVGPAINTRFWPADGGHERKYYESWLAKCPGRVKSLWLYPCFPIETATVQGYHCFPAFEARGIARDLRRFAADRVQSFMFCGGYDAPLDFWCIAKFQDDPSQDVERLVAEHFTRYYGAAAAPMRRLYDEMEATWHNFANYPNGQPSSDEATAWDRLGTAPRMARWQTLVDAATAAAKTDSEKRKVATFRDHVWKWMVDGKRSFEMKKRGQAELDRAKAAPPPSAGVQRLPEAIADGDPAKVAWAQVPVLKIRHNVAGYPLDDRSADLQVAHDGQRLYVRLVDHLDTAGLESSGYFWGDRWEWFVSTQREKPYRQVGFYPLGKFDAWTSMTETWKPAIVYHSDVAPQAWTLTWSIPFAELSAAREVHTGEMIYLNFIRGVRQGGGENLAWSPTFEAGKYHNLPRMSEFALAK